jgi:hypothetical protein
MVGVISNEAEVLRGDEWFWDVFGGSDDVGRGCDEKR